VDAKGILHTHVLTTSWHQLALAQWQIHKPRSWDYVDFQLARSIAGVCGLFISTL